MQPTPETPLSLTITLGQCDLVIDGLMYLPFRTVADLIVDVRRQARAQLAPPPAPEPPPQESSP